MRHIIVGTAGHIDHGKTALVRALTGIETDRFEEEKRRGISIDIGFAHLDLTPDIRLGFIDVPGHERFVRNMLAGIGGIDLVMLVIAADESIKPQTREHFEICRLLGIRRGLVVLTKKDLVDDDLLTIARMEVEEFVAGSFLEDAPVVAVSAVTGEGLGELRQVLTALCLEVASRPVSGFFRLPIDRSFAVKGFGTVVTGTLLSGEVGREDEVEVHPTGRKVRVRGVEVHGRTVERAEAGQRTALNLTGADYTDLHRGMVLTPASLLADTAIFDCSLELLADAKPLKHKAPVHFHAGTAEIEAEVRLFRGAKRVDPGARAFVRIELREPTLLLPGDRFIIRMFSPVVTIGGGTVLDIAPPRYRRAVDIAQRLRTMAEGSLQERLNLVVAESDYGLGPAQIVARLGVLESGILAAARKSKSLTLIEQPQFWLVPTEKLEQWRERIRNLLKRFHAANPLLPGLSKEEIRSRELPNAPPFLLDFLLGHTAHFAQEGNLVRLASQKVVLQQDEQEARRLIEDAFLANGLTVPSLSEVLAKCGVDQRRARSLLQMLLRENLLVRVGDDLVFHASAIESLRQTLALHKGETFNVGDFKDWTGLSRKYAIPLLEFLDRERVTKRAGENRIVA